MRNRQIRVRAARGYALVDIAVAGVLSLVLAATLAPRVHDARVRGMDSGLAARLQLLRGAVWMFRIDHNDMAPAPDKVEIQLLCWTDEAGDTSAVGRTPLHFVSPYLRQIPFLTVGARAGVRGIGQADHAGIGWAYTDGFIRANTLPEERDARGVAFSDY